MTTDRPISFTSSIDLPDGRHIYVSLELPDDMLAPPRQPLGEYAEVVQMAASGLLGHVLRIGTEVPF